MPRSRQRKERRKAAANVQVVDQFKVTETKFGPVNERVEGTGRIYHAWKVPHIPGKKLAIEREAHHKYKEQRRLGNLPLTLKVTNEAGEEKGEVKVPISLEEFTRNYINHVSTPVTMDVVDNTEYTQPIGQKHPSKEYELEGTVELWDKDPEHKGTSVTVHGKTVQQLVTRMTERLKRDHKIQWPMISISNPRLLSHGELAQSSKMA